MNLSEFQRSGKAEEPHLLLFGNPVSHSLSPMMHNTAAELLDIDITYYAIALRADELAKVPPHLNKETFLGANVTIPYKHMLMEYVDELSIIAESVGAFNTIVKEEGVIKGENTDVYGFSVPLKPYAEELNNERALVFGTGGATKAVIRGLQDFGIDEIILISRNPGSSNYFKGEENIRVEGYDAWPSFGEDAAIIINATPLGMAPEVGSTPIRDGEKDILEGKICYDLVYNPLKTKFLSMAEAAQARTIGGLEMLVYQGSKSFELWTGKSFPVSRIMDTLREELDEND